MQQKGAPVPVSIDPSAGPRPAAVHPHSKVVPGKGGRGPPFDIVETRVEVDLLNLHGREMVDQKEATGAERLLAKGDGGWQESGDVRGEGGWE
jgi:hypothetical protein